MLPWPIWEYQQAMQQLQEEYQQPQLQSTGTAGILVCLFIFDFVFRTCGMALK